MISASTPKAADPEACAPAAHKRPLYHWEQQDAHKERLVQLLRAGAWRHVLMMSAEAGHWIVNLRKADLSNADLTEAEISGAKLFYASLTGANLTNADLSGANLYDASLSGTNLSGANLSGAYLNEARLPEGFLAPGTRVDAVPWGGVPSGWQIIASPRGVRFLPLPKA